MGTPEGRAYHPPLPPTEGKSHTIEQVEGWLEENEANENVIERTRKREVLLELLDQLHETT